MWEEQNVGIEGREEETRKEMIKRLCTCQRNEEGRKKEASKVKQTRQSNTTHPRQSLFLRKMSCLGWDSNPRHSTLNRTLYMYMQIYNAYMYTCSVEAWFMYHVTVCSVHVPCYPYSAKQFVPEFCTVQIPLSTAITHSDIPDRRRGGHSTHSSQ